MDACIWGLRPDGPGHRHPCAHAGTVDANWLSLADRKVAEEHVAELRAADDAIRCSIPAWFYAIPAVRMICHANGQTRICSARGSRHGWPAAVASRRRGDRAAGVLVRASSQGRGLPGCHATMGETEGRVRSEAPQRYGTRVQVGFKEPVEPWPQAPALDVVDCCVPRNRRNAGAVDDST